MIPYMSSIWKGIIEEVLPYIDNNKGKRFMLIDLADPEKRTNEDIIEANAAYTKIQLMLQCNTWT